MNARGLRGALNRRDFLRMTGFGVAGAAILGTAGCGGDNSSVASNYPDRPVTIVNPWSAGSSTGSLCRVLASSLQTELGNPVSVEDREGASGTIAAGEVANAAPDGYTLIVPSNVLMTAQPVLRDVPFSLDDFRGIGGLLDQPVIATVNSSSEVNRLEQLGDLNEPVNYGHPGPGSFAHLAQETFFQRAGIEAEDVPFQGANEATVALLDNQIDTAGGHPTDTVPQLGENGLKPIGVYWSKRHPSVPDTPTAAEQGYDIQLSVTKFLMAPAETPEEIATTLAEALNAAVGSQDFQEFLDNSQEVRLEMGPSELDEYLANQSEENAALIEELGFTLQTS